MKHPSLAQLLLRLKSSPRVKGIFLTGSTAAGITPSSDIDLVVILDKNVEGMKSVYTTVERHFADIFFFDLPFIHRLHKKRRVAGNSFEGMFCTWLAQGKIEYDPGSFLQGLRKKIGINFPILDVSESEKRDLWVKVNYNFIANARYYGAKKGLYHQALALRLLYSVIELVTAYCSFRGIAWRGEKAVIHYLKQHDRKYLETFLAYTASRTLDDKMKQYRALFRRTSFGKYKPWHDGFVIPMSTQHQYDPGLCRFWHRLARRSP